MTIEIKSNKRFCTLQNKDREYLKQSNLNFILHENKETHYIQEKDPMLVLNQINSIIYEHTIRKSKLDISIYMNPDTFKLFIETYPNYKPVFTDNTVEENTESLF